MIDPTAKIAFSAPGPRCGRLAAALSFGFHATVLAMLVTVSPTSGNPTQPASVTIEIVPIAPPSPEPPQPPEPRSVPTPAPGPVAAHPSKPMPRHISAPRPTVEPTPVPPAPSKDQEESHPATPVVAAPPPPSPPPAGQAGGSVAPDDSLRLYGQIVWARITAHKPRGVRLPGTATVTFALSAEGGLISAAITDSDGSSSLDRLALDTVRNAAPFPPPPPHATAAQLTFSVPFHFR